MRSDADRSEATAGQVTVEFALIVLLLGLALLMPIGEHRSLFTWLVSALLGRVISFTEWLGQI